MREIIENRPSKSWVLYQILDQAGADKANLSVLMNLLSDNTSFSLRTIKTSSVDVDDAMELLTGWLIAQGISPESPAYDYLIRQTLFDLIKTWGKDPQIKPDELIPSWITKQSEALKKAYMALAINLNTPRNFCSPYCKSLLTLLATALLLSKEIHRPTFSTPRSECYFAVLILFTSATLNVMSMLSNNRNKFFSYTADSYLRNPDEPLFPERIKEESSSQISKSNL